ncbi:MAG: elongation factor Ts [Chloroflexota bacterium]
MDCKRALTETGGDIGKATEVLRQQGLARAEKKSSRIASQGLVETYVHGGGRIGVVVEINCETDFVARTDDFKSLAHDIAMQIAAQGPLYVSEDEVPADNDQPIEQVVLLKQPFIKNPSQTIGQLVTDAVSKIGENIKVRRFARFELGR